MKGKTGFALAGAMFVLDQFTKWLVAGPIGLTELGQNIHLLPFFDLTRVHNRGISLGLLTAGSENARWLLVAMTAVIAGVVAWWLTHRGELSAERTLRLRLSSLIRLQRHPEKRFTTAHADALEEAAAHSVAEPAAVTTASDMERFASEAARPTTARITPKPVPAMPRPTRTSRSWCWRGVVAPAESSRPSA